MFAACSPRGGAQRSARVPRRHRAMHRDGSGVMNPIEPRRLHAQVRRTLLLSHAVRQLQAARHARPAHAQRESRGGVEARTDVRAVSSNTAAAALASGGVRAAYFVKNLTPWSSAVSPLNSLQRRQRRVRLASQDHIAEQPHLAWPSASSCRRARASASTWMPWKAAQQRPRCQSITVTKSRRRRSAAPVLFVSSPCASSSSVMTASCIPLSFTCRPASSLERRHARMTRESSGRTQV